MGYRRRRSVSVDVDVDLDQFDCDDVLEEAAEIIERHLKSQKPVNVTEYPGKIWKSTNDALEKVLTALKMSIPVADEDKLPPPSTAAKIRTTEQLQKFLETGKLP